MEATLDGNPGYPYESEAVEPICFTSLKSLDLLQQAPIWCLFLLNSLFRAMGKTITVVLRGILFLLILLVIFLLSKRYLPAPSDTNYWDAVSAAATIGLSIITILVLFIDNIKSYLKQPQLDFEILLKPPHSHFIQLRNQEGVFISDSLYVRILVQHISGESAEDVEVYLSNFWELVEGERIVKKSFLPMNLKWSHFGVKKMYILPGTFRHCDLGSLRPEHHNNSVWFLLDTIVQPNPVAEGEVPNVLRPGQYEFELILSGRNTNCIKKEYRIIIPENWVEDEQSMLETMKIQKI